MGAGKTPSIARLMTRLMTRSMSQFMRFILVGIFNTIFGYSLIFSFMYFARLSPEVSNFCGYVLALLMSFILNLNFTFTTSSTYKNDTIRNKLEPFVRFLLVFGVSYAANYGMLIMLLYKFNLHVALSQIFAGVVYVLLSYLLNKYYVFTGK